MEDLGDKITPVQEGERSRKRKRDCTKWKRERKRVARYTADEPPIYPQCNHKTKSLMCRSLKMRDVQEFHRAFYCSKNKITQDNFIIKHCTIKNVKRHRPTLGVRSPKSISITYQVRVKDKLIPVCRDAFMNILHLKRSRLTGVSTRFHKSGEMAKETRGGDRQTVKSAPKRNSVTMFIESFRALESHYCRGQTNRKYLSSDLNITKMWKMYNGQASPQMQVKQCFFRNIFVSNYNLGFGSPRTDVCSTCLSLTEKIKNEADPAKKQHFITEKRVHNLRAKAFFDNLREEREGLMTFSFDCQKNLVLPKVPDQSAYYSRQLYFYNFTVVEGSSTSKLTPDNVTAYYWTENERLKGANEIASAVFDILMKKVEDMTRKSTDTVRLVADGCSGQNKNTIVVGMCCKWLQDKAPNCVKQLEIIFLVTGHSYIPPDRVFGTIERELRKKEVIATPAEYVHILSKHETVLHVGTDLPVLDWKSAVQEVIKIPGQWHFQFKQAKRFILHRGKNTCSVQGESSYRMSLVQPKGICKKGKCVSMIDPDELPLGVVVNPLKLKDVDSLLLKHYGESWKSLELLQWYKQVLENNPEGEPAEAEPCEAPIPYDGIQV